MKTIRVNLSVPKPDFDRLEAIYEGSGLQRSTSLTGFCTMLLMSMVEDIENGDAEVRTVRNVVRPGRPKVSE